MEVLHARLAGPKACKGCRSCVEACAVNALAYVDRPVVNLKLCYSRRACQEAVPICVESCSTGALKPAVFRAEGLEELPERLEV